jgi:uncharacterized protein YjbJ (UPF0337 family)
MDSPTTQQVKGNWKQFKGRIQQAWGDLTDDDLDRYKGKRTELEGHLQEKTGEAREDIRRKLDEYEREAEYRF